MSDRSPWLRVCRVDDVPADGGACVLVGDLQVAVFHLVADDAWYAVENRCPHWNEMVLSRGLTGEQDGEAKIACPMHKKTFSLNSGACLSGEPLCIRTFAVRVIDGGVHLKNPLSAH